MYIYATAKVQGKTFAYLQIVFSGAFPSGLQWSSIELYTNIQRLYEMHERVFSHLFCSYLAQRSGKMQNSLSISDSDVASFVPLVVLELAENTEPEAIKWLLSRIRDNQRNGGKTPAVISCSIYVYSSRTFILEIHNSF